MGANKSIKIFKKKNDNDNEYLKKQSIGKSSFFPVGHSTENRGKLLFFPQAEWYLRFGAEYTILSLKIEKKIMLIHVYLPSIKFSVFSCMNFL